MTRKDGLYRLMSYIQESHQGYPKKCIVNGKKIYLNLVLFETEEDEIKTQKRYKELAEEEDDDDDEMTQRCFVSCASGSTISMGWNKNIDDDKEHHEKIVKKFEELLNK